jgi:hypothetical protein
LQVRVLLSLAVKILDENGRDHSITEAYNERKPRALWPQTHGHQKCVP